MNDSLLLAAIAVTLWASLSNLGFASTRATFALTPATRRAVGRIVAFELVLVPPAAFAICVLLDVPTPFATGIILLGAASAGPLGITATRIARADAAMAVVLVAVLALADVVAVPLWAGVLLGRVVPVPVMDIVVMVVAWMALPLGLGLLVRARTPKVADRLLSPTAVVSTIGVPAIIVIALVNNWALLGSPGAASIIPAAVLLLLLAGIGGAVVAGGARDVRVAGALTSAQRANTVALGIAIASFPDMPEAQLTVVVFGVLCTILVLAMAAGLGWSAAREARRPSGAPA